MQQTPKRELNLFDSTCLIVGIIIGAGIYQMAPMVAQGTSHWWQSLPEWLQFEALQQVPGWVAFLAIWVVGGLLSLCGAIGYAELATAYPQEGGDYVYLSRAYGRWAGFLFGWMQLTVVRPGDIAGMAFIFATYARALWDPFGQAMVPYDKLPLAFYAEADVPWGQLVFALAAVAVLTAINVIGVREGKWTQNVLTTVKALGLLAIVAAAAFVPGNAAGPLPAAAGGAPLSLALIFVLFTFGGWNEMAYVAAEVKDPKRNIVRALVLGTAAVTVLYVLVNGAFLYVLGFDRLCGSEAVAADTVAAVFTQHPHLGAGLISGLVCISALGATNGLIFAGARISYAVGADHRGSFLGSLGRWNARTGTPARALVLQGLVAMALIVILGSFVGAILYTAAAVYSFYLATSLTVIVLRLKEPGVERPYRVTGYPIPTIVFCLACGLLVWSAVTYKPRIAATALAILLAGLPLYWLSRRVAQP